MALKFIAVTSCSKEIKWLRNLLIETLIWPKPIQPIYVGQLLSDRIIIIDFVRSCQNFTDPLTEGLASKIDVKDLKKDGFKANTI